MDIAEILKQAAQAVEDAELPDDLRRSGFEKAVDLVAGVTVTPPGPQPPGPQPNATPDVPKPDEPDEDDHPEWVTTLANKLGIPFGLVTQVYTFDNGELGIEIPHQWLGDSKKTRMQDLTRIVAAGRQALGLETVTSTKDVRPVLDDYGARDKNYSRHVDELKDQFVVKDDGKNKTLRASKPTLAAVGARIVELSGSS